MAAIAAAKNSSNRCPSTALAQQARAGEDRRTGPFDPSAATVTEQIDGRIDRHCGGGGADGNVRITDAHDIEQQWCRQDGSAAAKQAEQSADNGAAHQGRDDHE